MINEILLRRKNRIYIETVYQNLVSFAGGVGITAQERSAAEDGRNTERQRLRVLTMMKNTEQLGYAFSQELFEQFVSMEEAMLDACYLELVTLLKERTGADKVYRPMYPDFPQEVMEKSDGELYWNAIVHYWSGGTLYPSIKKQERLPLFDGTKLTVLTPGTREELLEIFRDLAGANGSLSEQDLQDICWYFANIPQILQELPETIPYKENAAYIGACWIRYSPLTEISVLQKYFRTGTDVLRLAAALSDGDISLKEKVRFRSFSRKERRVLMGLLAGCSGFLEEMHRRREVWKRLGERLHPGEFKAQRYGRVRNAFAKIREGEPVGHFAGRVEAALGKRDVMEALMLLKERPGELARRLDVLLRMEPPTQKAGEPCQAEMLPQKAGEPCQVKPSVQEVRELCQVESSVQEAGESCQAEICRVKTSMQKSETCPDGLPVSESEGLQGMGHPAGRQSAAPGWWDIRLQRMQQQKDILEAFEGVADQVATPVLLQVRTHFQYRNHESFRYYFPKGRFAEARMIGKAEGQVEEEVCAQIVSVCERVLMRRFAELEPMGKVWLSEELKDYMVPFSQRSASRAARTLVRGSRLRLNPQAKAVRGFVWWTNTEQGGRVDLDLSAAIFDNKWNYLEHVSYTNLRSVKYRACHSGDIVNGGPADGPGVCEFLDVDPESVLQYGGRYVVYQVYSYTGQCFSALPHASFGYMEREDVKSGEIFEPATVRQRMDLVQESNVTIPMILDCVTGRMVWCDISLNLSACRRNLGGNNLESNLSGVALACYAMVNMHRTNLYDLVRLHVAERGVLCEEKEEADLIFDVEEGITPFDTEKILAEYM